MKQIMHDSIADALAQLARAGKLPADHEARIQVSPARDRAQGDFACNTALTLAKSAGMPPRDLAALIVGSPRLNELRRHTLDSAVKRCPRGTSWHQSASTVAPS